MIRLIIIALILFFIARILAMLNPEPLKWFGRLPGDIRFESDERRIYIPITSLFVLGIGLALLIYMVIRLFK